MFSEGHSIFTDLFYIQCIESDIIFMIITKSIVKKEVPHTDMYR